MLITWTIGVFKERVPPDTLPRKPGFAIADDAGVFIAEKKSTPRMIALTGTIHSKEMIHISPRISAHVKAVHAGAGTTVDKDDLLISLDDRELREKLAVAEIRSNQADIDFDRIKKLFETGSTSHQEFIAAQSEYHIARAREEEARIMMSFVEIRSPIDGVVTDRYIEAGDLAATGQVLMEVYKPGTMRLETPVPVRLTDRISVGDICRVQLEAPKKWYKGKVAEIVSRIDHASRTRTVKIELLDHDHDILPGTFGRIWLETTAEDGIFVPETAVYHIGQLEIVQVVTDGRAYRRLVKTGQAYDGFVEILSGLAHGDTVLVYPAPAKQAEVQHSSSNLF